MHLEAMRREHDEAQAELERMRQENAALRERLARAETAQEWAQRLIAEKDARLLMLTAGEGSSAADGGDGGETQPAAPLASRWWKRRR